MKSPLDDSIRSSFKASEIAHYLGVTSHAVLKWISSGKLRSYATPGGHHRVPAAELRAFLERHEIPVDEGFFRRGLAPRIITTGGYGTGAEFSESEVSREYLSEQGVPAEFVTVETVGQSTMQSASAVAEIMDRMDLGSCIVVSDDYHIFRIKRMLEARGLTVYGSPRRPQGVDAWRRGWSYARESVGYILWRIGIRV